MEEISKLQRTMNGKVGRLVNLLKTVCNPEKLKMHKKTISKFTKFFERGADKQFCVSVPQELRRLRLKPSNWRAEHEGAEGEEEEEEKEGVEEP